MNWYDMLPSWGEFLIRLAEAAFAAIVSAAGTVIFVARKTFASKEELQHRFELHHVEHEAIAKQFATGEKEFAVIRGSIQHLPNHDDVAELKDRLAAVEGSVQALSATVVGIKELLERVERPLNILVEHHLKGPK